MDILSEKRAFTPSTIGNVKFRIPLYQRPYAWEEQQIKQLLDDLYFSFSKKTDRYYIGILSVAKTHDDPERFDLIDGQQRITTLMLIGKAAKHCNESWSSFLIPKRLELYGRKADQGFLDGDDNTWSNEFREVTPTMIKSFETAKKFFEGYKEDKKEFAQYIYDNAAFFISNVPPKYSVLDRNQHFVRMNNRGRQLEKHEILKVRLAKGLSEDKEKNLLKVWNNILDYLSGTQEDQDDKRTLDKILQDSSKIDLKASNSKENFYAAIVTIPEFLLIALARFLKNKDGYDQKEFSFDKEKLLETFHKYLKENEHIVNFTGFIEVQLGILRSYFICISHSGNKNKIQYKFGGEASNGGKNEDGYQNHFIDETNDQGEAGDVYKYKNRLKAVQSFLHVSTEPHHWLVPALDWCKEKVDSDVKVKIDTKEFVQQLEQIDNNLIRDKIRTLTSIDNLDEMKYGNISHYWFYRLDYELWKTYQEPRKNNEGYKALWSSIKNNSKEKSLLNNFRFRKCSSIEHIEPQKPIEKEPIPERDFFGNLALISRSQNSKFSNNPPDGKKEIILNSEYTESLKMAHFLWCNRDEIGKAGKKMYDILYNAVKKNPQSGDSND